MNHCFRVAFHIINNLGLQSGIVRFMELYSPESFAAPMRSNIHIFLSGMEWQSKIDRTVLSHGLPCDEYNRQ